MLRGGSWNNNPQNCRSAYRNNNNPDNDNNNIGFRVVCGVFSSSALLCQSRCMGMHRACQRRVQTCSCDVGDGIQISIRVG
ncbi:MAG: SUMF1/EgtB/PvdO family nonheme iron enzyme [Calothrix sp. CSU_2_0]|nr:SUMF1/EgtB/PvdO family nonheme iron enzyme [Calothrix sp. CSU_2_0]